MLLVLVLPVPWPARIPEPVPVLATGDTKDLDEVATSEDESLLKNIPILSVFLFPVLFSLILFLPT